jgi:mRNA-degrading endonuclease RelE of RelBE toxin-antitoxin system
MYRVVEHSQFERRVKKLLAGRPALKDSVKTAIESALSDPLAGTLKKGNAHGVRSLSFERSPQYRVLYEVLDCCVTPDTCLNPINGVCKGKVHLIEICTREDAEKAYKRHKKVWKQVLLNPKGILPPSM